MLETDEGSDEKAITAMGLLNTIETLLKVMEDHDQIMTQLEPIVLQVVAYIFGQSVMGTFFNCRTFINTVANLLLLENIH